MSILSIFSAERNVQKKKAAAKPAKKETCPEAICFDGRVAIPAAMAFTAAGIGTIGTINAAMADEKNPVSIGVSTGISLASIGLGSWLLVSEIQKANRMYAYAVDTAAYNSYIADVFQKIIACELYKGEKSFMKIVDLLEGVSDADKENLRRRYQEYQTTQVEMAAAKARNMMSEEHTAETHQQAPASQPQPQA